MGDLGRFVDGQRFLAASPYRSALFVVLSLETLIAVMLDVYLLYRFWDAPKMLPALLLTIPIAAQLIYQWFSAQRYYLRVRGLYSIWSDEEKVTGAPTNMAIRVALGGMTRTFAYSTLIALLALILTWIMLPTGGTR